LPEPQLGRLFTTPEKRLSLDRQRNRSSLENETPESETVELNGVVQRSSGHNSVWINRHMQYGADRQSGVSIKSGRPGAADIEMGKNSVQLRVGDTVNRSTQERKGLVPPNAVRNGKTP
jgi:hypothetical protein